MQVVRRAQMGSGGMMGMGNGMIPMQVPGGQVPSMVPVGMPQASHHMQGARPPHARGPRPSAQPVLHLCLAYVLGQPKCWVCPCVRVSAAVLIR